MIQISPGHLPNANFIGQEYKLLCEVQLTDPFRPRLMKVHGKLKNHYKIVSKLDGTILYIIIYKCFTEF